MKMNAIAAASAGVGLLFALAGAAEAATIRVVALTGQEAPGTGGAVFSGFGSAPALNDAGETAFRGVLTGAGVAPTNSTGIFTSGALVAREGDAAPGAGGATFSSFGNPALNDAGETAFLAFLAGAEVTSANDNGIFTSGALLVRDGDDAPGAGGAVFANFGGFASLGSPALNTSGETAFTGNLAGAGVTPANDSGVFTSGALVAREGDAAPGAGGAVFSGFRDVALNDAGETAFLGFLTGTGVDGANGLGLFANKDGVLDLILRTGELLDIGGGDLRTITTLSFLPGGFNNNGDIAFLASFSGGAGIFVYEAGSVSAAVPLPPALGLMLFGVAALGFAGRRRARA